MGEEIVIDKELLKAIGADTRITILKSLSEHQKTQTDLAKELKLSPPTVLEHLNHLQKAELVERKEEGRKWIYYDLTKKGRKLVSSGKKKIPINVMVILSIAVLFIAAAVLYNPFGIAKPESTGASMDIQEEMFVQEMPPAKTVPEAVIMTAEDSALEENELRNETNSTNNQSEE
ncbi:winged helix-turn-helix transcriptional regulator [Candidatus Micrarchaeota archaeon]|nr:winged helix-turn-helix transcriptional regulator [Candidatus Micrarchaeota archaeon]